MANTMMSPERARERALFLYRNALERGDFEAIAAVLKLAERDPLLWQMIDDLAELDEGALERPAAQPAHALRNDKHITQHVTVRDPCINGQTPKPDQSQEDNDMMTLNVETFTPVRPRTEYPFVVRFVTLAAAILIVALLGGVLIEMVNEPIGGYPAAVNLQTEEPKCATESVIDATAESVRLAEAAMALLPTRTADRTPEMIEQGTLLALCGMQTAQTPEADAALLRALRLSESLPNFDGFNAVFSPDGRYVLSMTNAGTMRLWDVATGEEIRQFVGHDPDGNGNLTSAFSPDGRTIFSASGGDHTARLWDVETGEQIRQFEGEVEGSWESATFSPDGKHVLAGGGVGLQGGENNPVVMWDPETGEEVRRFVGHMYPVFSLGVSPDGRYLATTSRDTTLRLWDMATGEEIRQFAPYPSWTFGAAFSPDGQFLLSGGGSSYARLLNVETGEEVRKFEPNISVNVGRSVDYSPDGQFIVTGGNSGWAVLWDAETGEQLRVFDAVANQVDSVAFSPDGNYVLTGTGDNVVWLWPVSIEDTVALACSKMTRDFTPEERAEYGLGEGAACPK